MKSTILRSILYLSTAIATAVVSSPGQAATTTGIGRNSQTADSTKVTDTTHPSNWPIIFPHAYIGLRGGVNLANMHYSFKEIQSTYKHFTQVNGMGGLFAHFELGHSGIALRPEITVIGRGDSLEWYDVKYSLKTKYFDFRLPITYNFKIKDSRFSPYIMVVPQLNIAYGGKINYYADDIADYYTDPEAKCISVPISKYDLHPVDFSLMAGVGFDYLIRTNGIPLLFSLECGYNMGLVNNYSRNEIVGNASTPSVIKNNFLGSSLYEGNRTNRGIEIAVRLAIPIDDSWKKGIPIKTQIVNVHDTLYLVDTLIHIDTVREKADTVYIEKVDTNTVYIKKDCFTFSEIYEMLLENADISDKRMCLFNINFDFDSYTVRPESKRPLTQLIDMMKRFPEMRIEIYGHTDSIGSDSYNSSLSQNRAEAVLAFLVQQGIEAERMVAKGFGEAYPIDDNGTEIGRFKNRRVEIEIKEVGLKNTRE